MAYQLTAWCYSAVCNSWGLAHILHALPQLPPLSRSKGHGSFQAANVLTLRAGRAGNSAVVVDLLRRP